MKPQKQIWQPTEGDSNRKLRNARRVKILGTQFAIRNSQFAIGAIFIILGLILTFQPTPSFAAPPAQAPDTPPSVSGGRMQWTENCLPCHGPTGQGDGPTAQSIPDPLPNLSDPQLARQRTPAENFDIIKNGRMDKMMPPWGNRLTDAQIWDAAAYVWHLSTRPQNLQAGETLYAEQCSSCHGPSGAGDGPDAPANINNFADVQAMTQKSQADLLAGFNAGTTHAEFAALSEDELWQTLDYIRTFSFAVPQRNGVLTGQVINATTGQPQGNVEVTLHVFDGETEVETLTTQANSQGRYTFENLLVDHAVQYMVEGRYRDIGYMSSEAAVFVPNSTKTTLDVNVYETTTDASAVTVDQLNYLVAFSPNLVQAVQIFVIENNGNQSYIGEDGRSFSFGLPDGAQNVTFEDNPGQRFVEANGGYADTRPILPAPNAHSVVALYDVPFTDDSLTLNIPVPADVSTVNVLVQELGAGLNSSQLELVETREGHGEKFSIFSGSSLSRGDTLTLELTGLNQLDFNTGINSPAPAATTTGPLTDQNLLRWLVVGLGGLLVIGVGVGYPFFRPQSPQPAQDTSRRCQKLLLMLARLDEAFEAGQIEQHVYQQTRARYKAELANMMPCSDPS